MILIDNQEGLIGDFLGTVPAMQKIATVHKCLVKVRSEVKGLFDLVKSDRLQDIEKVDTGFMDVNQLHKFTFNSSSAFTTSAKYNCYMSKAFMINVDLEDIEEIPKARIKFIGTQIEKPFDYCISPFARSLPEEQKWPVEKWKELVESRPDLKFALFGNSKYDNKEYLVADNVTTIFDKPFNEVCNILVNSRGLISVVTGTSHLAFHLGRKNVLLTSQTMAWGNNPDAIQIKKPIEQITVEEVLSKL